MVPRNRRLSRQSVYILKREGERIDGSFFILYKKTLLNTEGGIAVVVSTKVSKKSSERNRIRRAAQSALLECQKRGEGDMLAFAKSDAAGVSGKNLRADIFKALSI